MQSTYQLDSAIATEETSFLSLGTGPFVRVFAVVGSAVYAAFAVAALIVAPEIAQSPVLWTSVAMTMAVAGITFLAGRRLQRR
jgi:hypothetical protein